METWPRFFIVHTLFWELNNLFMNMTAQRKLLLCILLWCCSADDRNKMNVRNEQIVDKIRCFSECTYTVRAHNLYVNQWIYLMHLK